MNIHKLPFSDSEAPAVDSLDDGGADVALLTEYDEAQRGFKNLRAGVFDLHDTLIKRARYHRRAKTQLRKLAASAGTAASAGSCR